jgi:hypothetical protein
MRAVDFGHFNGRREKRDRVICVRAKCSEVGKNIYFM